MKRRITRSVLLITAFAVATGFAQNPQQIVQPQEPVRLRVPPQSEVKFRIIDPITKRVQEANKAAAEQGERQLAVPRAQEWNSPTHPASLPQLALPPTVIAAPRTRRPSVIQADSRLQKQRKLVPQIRLVQAEDVDDSFLDDLRTSTEDAGSPPVGPSDDIDELLKQAQDLIKEEREKAADTRMTPDEIRSRMQDELDRLLPDEEGEDGRGDLLAGDDDEEATEDDFSDLVDPEPKPIYSQRQRRQLPYTMGDIFRDDDEVDPVCEQMFCERMWACAGGKCMSPLDRMKRNFRRNYALFWSPCGTQVCRPMEDFQCPPRNRQQQNQCGNLGRGGPFQASPILEQPPLVESFPTGEYPVEMLPIESSVEISPTNIPTEAGPFVQDAVDAATPADSIFGPAE